MKPVLVGAARSALLLVAAAGPLPALAALDLQLGVERSRGLYGEATPTIIIARTTTLRWRNDRWLLQLELPWLEVRNAAGAAGLPDQAGRGTSTVERGWGDGWARVAWTAREFDIGQAGIDLVLKFKGANGSSVRGLGSGARDWALQVDMVHRVGPVTAFGEIGRRRTGEPPGASRYHDPWYAEIGTYASPWAGVELGAYHDARERIGRLGALSETTVYGAWHLGDQRLQVHATRGHGRASVQQAVGLSWRWRTP